jgi:hypothetical protein
MLAQAEHWTLMTLKVVYASIIARRKVGTATLLLSIVLDVCNFEVC